MESSKNMDAPDDLNFQLHHIGIVVDVIEQHRDFYLKRLGYRERTGVIHDPVQTAYVQFLNLPGADHYIELVAPDGPDSKLARASKKSLPLNHLCYSTANIEKACESFESDGGFVLQTPVAAVAFDQRRIAWIMTRDKLLIELVERGAAGTL